MAEPLKNLYNPAFFEKICPVLREIIPGFNERKFIYAIFDERWPDLELKERVRHISKALHTLLPQSYPEAVKLIVSLAQKFRSAEIREQGFEMIFLPDYIEVFGQQHFHESMEAIEEVTKLVSAEFAIRPFLLHHPEKCFAYLRRWAMDNNPNVRRLASEGCRPRLPWAMGIPALKKDPAPIFPILEKLRCDPSEYVRKSVANNLNDIAKDHPQQVLALVAQWAGKHAHTDWIIKHGCRTLLKKGDQAALTLHGINPAGKAGIATLELKQKKIRVGDYLEFQFDFTCKEKLPSKFRLDYAIDYITSTGKISTKIFKIEEAVFDPKKSILFKRKQSFQNFTTRKHYTGKHTISILVNGRKIISEQFHVM